MDWDPNSFFIFTYGFIISNSSITDNNSSVEIDWQFWIQTTLSHITMNIFSLYQRSVNLERTLFKSTKRQTRLFYIKISALVSTKTKIVICFLIDLTTQKCPLKLCNWLLWMRYIKRFELFSLHLLTKNNLYRTTNVLCHLEIC